MTQGHLLFLAVILTGTLPWTTAGLMIMTEAPVRTDALPYMIFMASVAGWFFRMLWRWMTWGKS